MYITHADMAQAMSADELIQLTDDTGAGAVNEEILAAAIRYACELADGYLTARYALPLSPAPTLLRPLCIDIARYWLHTRRINAAEFPKPLQVAYDNAIKLLKAIRDGQIHLGVQDKAQLQPEGGAYHVRAPKKQDWSGY